MDPPLGGLWSGSQLSWNSTVGHTICISSSVCGSTARVTAGGFTILVMTVNVHYFTSALWISRSYLSVYSSVLVCGSSFSSLNEDHGSLQWPTLGLSHHRGVWEIATRGAADMFTCTSSFDCPVMASSQILNPWLGDIVARLHRRPDRYNNPMAESTISPHSETENLPSEHTYVYLLSTKVFESFCYAISWFTWCY
jgi:hypothetical protein